MRLYLFSVLFSSSSVAIESTEKAEDDDDIDEVQAKFFSKYSHIVWRCWLQVKLPFA